MKLNDNSMAYLICFMFNLSLFLLIFMQLKNLFGFYTNLIEDLNNQNLSNNDEFLIEIFFKHYNCEQKGIPYQIYFKGQLFHV
jgi:hypothetical protein